MERDHVVLQSSYSSLLSEKNAMLRDANATRDALSALESMCSSLRESLAQRDNTLIDRDRDIESAQMRIDEEQTQRLAAEQSLAELREEHALLTNSFRKLTQSANEMKVEIASLKLRSTEQIDNSVNNVNAQQQCDVNNESTIDVALKDDNEDSLTGDKFSE